MEPTNFGKIAHDFQKILLLLENTSNKSKDAVHSYIASKGLIHFTIVDWIELKHFDLEYCLSYPKLYNFYRKYVCEC